MDAPDIVIVIKIPRNLPESEKNSISHWAEQLYRNYNASIMPIVAFTEAEIEVFGCEKIEATNLNDLAEKLVDSAMTQEERQKIYEKLHSLGCRIYG